MRRAVVVAVFFAAATAIGRTQPCPGVERWNVKTLSDPEASKIDYTDFHDSTIEALRQMKRPGSLVKRAAVEMEIYTVVARLVRWHHERDGDYHLVLAGESGKTLIAEIPNPDCVASKVHRGVIADARREFEDSVLRHALPPGAKLIVVGVGFFDHPHGQDGAAPNSFELHPVLGVGVVSIEQ